MEEIKVGEYIKTVAGYIGKIINFNDGMYTAKMKDVTIDLYIDDIKNHKENIIDLIEKDDVGIMNCYGLLVKKFITESDILELKLGNYELLKVVTKEQFAAAEYKLDN